MRGWSLLVGAVALVAAAAVVHGQHADSGGCLPLTDWTKKFGGSGPFDWQSRLPNLASKLKGASAAKKAVTVFSALPRDSSRWMQYLDGWAHSKGPNAFDAFYTNDVLGAHDMLAKFLSNPDNVLGETFYEKVHTRAFSQDATRQGKRNGLRGATSNVYLPLPDKPLGVFYGIMHNGKRAYPTNIRKIGDNKDHMKPGVAYNWNGGVQYRWKYNNMEEEDNRSRIKGFFAEFISGVKDASSMEDKFDLVVKLYWNLENAHPFLDGNGRTNLLVLNAMLSKVGLHPASLYNTMESALSNLDEEKQRVLEGMYRWEQIYKTGESPWTEDVVEARAKECSLAIAQLQGKADGLSFRPDTFGGCMCKDAATCETNAPRGGHKWCSTDSNCLWTYDICTPKK